MKALKISISGLRGIVGETLTPELIINFSSSFGTYIESGKVYISQDTRNSGEMVKSAVISGLLSTGCEVIDLGVCPTPALQLFIKHHKKACGGVAITAGHNDERWNALKFIRGDGLFLNHYQAEELLDIFHQGEFKKAKWNEFKKIKKEGKAVENHLNAILKVLNVNLIRKKKFKVALDCCNGACSNSTEEFLKRLNCEVVAINDEPGQGFPHEPEPKPENMGQLRALVKASKSQVGFAQDADGDRLGIVDENGEALFEEYSLCLATKFIVRKKKGVIITNLSTTKAIEDIAKEGKCNVLRTKISQAYIAEEAMNHNAIIAGEGSGGILFPEINYAYDSTAAIGFILQYLAEENKTISSLANEVPKYEMIKRKINCEQEEIYSIIQNVREWVDKENIGIKKDFQDGVKIDFEDAWIHIRSSITEPLIRVISEAKEKERAEELNNLFLRKIKQLG